MASIYEQVMGKEFKRLHPPFRQRLGFNSPGIYVLIGHGMMDSVWYAKWAALPLYLGTTGNIMFPQGGERIPFTIENFAYKDRYGRETVTWNRKFKFRNAIRQFDATMIYSANAQRSSTTSAANSIWQ